MDDDFVYLRILVANKRVKFTCVYLLGEFIEFDVLSLILL